jgi:hypothetical protein
VSRRAIAPAILLLACGGPARAQSWEVSGLAGYTPSAGLDRHAPEVEALDIGGGFTWGAQVARHFGPRIAAEVMWTRQGTGLVSETDGERTTFFDFHIDDVHADFVYHFAAPDARWRPFAFAGAGASFFSGGDLPSETKLSLGLGVGVKYFPWRTVGVRAHARYKPVFMDDEDAGDFCVPFGFCQGMLHQTEVAAGVIVRF